MFSRILAAVVVLGLSAPGGSRGQESDPLAAATLAPSADNATSKSSTASKPQSLGAGKDPKSSKPVPKNAREQATFGAGCFWHVEAVFEQLDGVNSAVSGYAGGFVPYPSYEMVHEGSTGHAEAVMVDYDPSVISYENLLKVFWKNHDPTTINRQGPDEGPQYRSVIFYHTEERRKAALKSYQQLTNARVFRSPIVTQLVPMTAFYRAEDYHQDYYGGKPRPTSRRKTTRMTKVKKAPANQKTTTQAVAKPARAGGSQPAPPPRALPKPDRALTP